MKKLIALVLALALLCSASVAFAAGKATVTKESFYVRPFLDYHAAEVYAQVTNTGDKPVVFNGGLLELYNANGDAIEAEDLYSCYPSVLAPNESGYLYVTRSVEEATDKSFIDDYALTVSGKSENEKATLRFPTEGSFGEVERGWMGTEFVMIALITNDTKETQRGLRVVYALFDKDDKLLYATSVEPYYVGVPAGQTIELQTSVSGDMVKAWGTEGTAPTRLEAIGYVQTEG